MDNKKLKSRKPSKDILRLNNFLHHCPSSILGCHIDGNNITARSLITDAKKVYIEGTDFEMDRIQGTDIFEWRGENNALPDHYRIRWVDIHGVEHSRYEANCFDLTIGDYDRHIFNEGRHYQSHNIFGAHCERVNGIDGVRFAVWAPNAERVSVIGDFNSWDGRVHAMSTLGNSGIWEIFLPEVLHDVNYKYEIRSRTGGEILTKSDPYARKFQLRPDTASVTTADSIYAWDDEEWIAKRGNNDWMHTPMSIYEVHLGSWRRNHKGEFLNYRDIADQLVPYVIDLGFTHIELLPVSEHPFDGSWGYQCTGFFAPTCRFGDGEDFRYLIDKCHQNNIGIILDWVAGHFPKDMHGLAKFDGSPLYEHSDPRRGEHPDWGTLIFNYGRKEVKGFLISNALYWIEEFHLDGLRVDAVASMLYLDYSREEGEWVPNEHGGNENLEAIDFIRELNSTVLGKHPGVLMIAEESTAWPQVTRPSDQGGLGFSMKWNMGWMHDSLQYFSNDPIHRQHEHNKLSFGLLYTFTENFVLPFSHDEVVHGKGSMINKQAGDDWQQFANLRLLYTYMYTYPGKKLLYMGDEFAQVREWDHDTALDWELLEIRKHEQIRYLVSVLNNIYSTHSELYEEEFSEQGFEWLDCNDAAHSVLSYIRRSTKGCLITVLNFTPVPREAYRLGVPDHGQYREIFNSDSDCYGGSDIHNKEGVSADGLSWMGQPFSICIDLPPLAGVVFTCKEQ
jgi:1,4-alpha-glucan branching enzyme